MWPGCYRIFIGVVFTFFLAGCINTKHKLHHTNEANFQPGTRVLMVEIAGLTANKSYKLYEELKPIFAKKKIELQYHPEQEWNLKSKGILAIDSLYFDNLRQQGYTYLLVSNLLGTHNGGSFLDFKTRDDNQQYLIEENSKDYKEASLRINLYSIEANRVFYRSDVKTTVSPMSFMQDDGDETVVNPGSVDLATMVAIKKGIKRMLK